jgi:uncharacterized membrane protein
MHFARPGFYVAMMPKLLPVRSHAPLVAFTGLCEILGGIGVLVPATSHIAGVALMVFLVAVFPANVQMLLNAQAAGAPAGQLALLWIRLPLQLPLLWWVWQSAVRSP